VSFFDYFEPYRKQRCETCSAVLTDWQGFDEGHFFVWKQGFASPVDQKVDDEIICSSDYRDRQRLNESFSFFTDCKDCNTRHIMEGICEANVWRYTLRRQPKVTFPSQHFTELCIINIKIEELAIRFGKQLIVYDEYGMGSYRGFEFTLTHHDINIFLSQSDVLTDIAEKKAIKDRVYPGAVIKVDTYDLIKLGGKNLYWGLIQALGISEANVVVNWSESEDLEEYARKLIWKD